MIQAAHGFADGAGRRAGRRRRADPLRVRRRPPLVRRRGQRLRRRVQRDRGRRAAPLAAGCGGRRVPRPRAAPPPGRAGRRPAGAGGAAGCRAAGGARAAGARLVAAPVGGAPELGGWRPGRPTCRKRAAPGAPPGAGAHAGRRGRRAAASCWIATCTRWPTGSRRRPRGWSARWPASRSRCGPGRPARERLDTEAEELDAATRARIEAAARVLKHRAIDRLAAWQAMLAELASRPPNPAQRPAHVTFSNWTGGRPAIGTPACTATGWTRRCRSPRRWRPRRTAC